MAIRATTVWECQTSGYSTNGGGFAASNSGSTGIDYSQRNEPYKTFGRLSGVGTTNLMCSAPDAFDATMRANIINISGQGRYEITTYNNSTSVTVDRSLGTFSFVSGAIGGAVKSPGDITGSLVFQNTVWCKSGVYALTGNVISMLSYTIIAGYGVQRGDEGLAYFECSGMAASQACFSITDHGGIKNVVVANSKSYGINGNNQQSSAINCYVINAADNGFNNVQGMVNCFASGCWNGMVGSYAIGCVSMANQQHGISVRYAIYCYAYNNSRQTNNTYNGININGEGGLAVSCVSHGNSRQKDGIIVQSKCAIVNCICTNNVNYGINYNWSLTNPQEFAGSYNNACYSNTAGNFNNLPVFATGNFNLTADPFTNVLGMDFSLNDANGGGSFIKESGFPSRPPGLNTLSYLDIGPTQTRASGGGGLVSTTSFFTMIPNMNGGFF